MDVIGDLVTDAGVTDTADTEGGDLACSRTLSLALLCSEASTQWVRLSIRTVTGTIITKTLVLDPDTPLDQGSMITLTISAALSDTVPNSIGDGTE